MEDKNVYKIDPRGKYVIEYPMMLTRNDVLAITRAWEEFVNDPNQHVIVISGGLRLMKVELPEEAKSETDN